MNQHVLAKALFACVLLGASACASIKLPTTSAPSVCHVDPVLFGTWSDFRMTPLGPSWVEFTFRCDCSYRTRIQLLFARIVETGRFDTKNAEIVFHRRGGDTTWPYSIENNRLRLQEAVNEVQSYSKSDSAACSEKSRP